MEQGTNKLSIPMAIIIVGVLIAGAILLKGSPSDTSKTTNTAETANAPAAITSSDNTLGNRDAKVALILYEDFQCPFCGAVSGLETDTPVIKYIKEKLDPNWIPFMPEVNKYIQSGDVLLVYRDWAFLGADAKAKGLTPEDESLKAAEAARCAGEQGKFWEYHDYLYSHQNGENKGSFSTPNLKSFAVKIGLDASTFNDCLDSNKYEQAVLDSKVEGTKAGVTGTPKGFIVKDGKVVSTIDGAESGTTVKQKIENALK